MVGAPSQSDVAVVTSASLTPLAIQSEGLYAPLAWVIIGGLVTSTLLGRIVTPVLYRLLPARVEVEDLHP